MVSNRGERALQATRLVMVASVLLGLNGCHTTSAPTPRGGAGSAAVAGTSSASQAPTPPAADVSGSAVRWQIDPAQTVVTIVVRRAGPLAKFGHDHVITSAEEMGSVWVGHSPAESAVELMLPVERFEVDRPEARASAGPEFAAPVPDEARAGTRQNMLRAEVLDAPDYPGITLRSTAASGDWAQPVIRLAITLRGVTREHEVPVSVERSPTRLGARGELRLNQTDFDITPFSVAGGAIQVANTVEVRFEIVATAP